MAEVIKAVPIAPKSMDYGKALSWYLKDPRFQSTLIKMSLYFLSCFLIIPAFYVLPVMTGFVMELITNIQQGRYELPEIKSEMWNTGIKYFVVMFAVGFVVGLVLIPLVLLQNTLIRGTYGHSGATNQALYWALTLVRQLFSIVLSIVQIFALVIYAKTRNIQSMFQVENYQKIFANNGYATPIISIVLYTVAGTVLVFGGVALCCIGILPALSVMYIIMGSLFGAWDLDGIEAAK